MDEEHYALNLDALPGLAERFDVGYLIDSTTGPWHTQTLLDLGEVSLQLCVMQGEFPWRTHSAMHTLYYLLQGGLRIETEGQPAVTLGRGQAHSVPAGSAHRVVAPVRSAALVVEQTGDERSA